MKYFVAAVAMISCGSSMFESVFNNFLNESVVISTFQRTFLEVPRELPGMLVAFVSALFCFLPSRRLGALSALISFAGLMLLGLAARSYAMMLPWLFLFSMGQHLFMPISASIGMELARKGQDGRRLGQINSVRNAAVVSGSFVIFLGFKYLHLNFVTSFILASFCLLLAAFFLYRMSPGESRPAALHLKFHREYKLYYWLCVLFGTRKQIFITFAPWVLVTVFHQPTAMIASLMTIGALAGIVTQPVIGRMIDHLGERFMLSMEAALLIIVCAGYGFAGTLFSERTAFIVAAACYVADQLLISVGFARATYLKKIALDASHIAPTLALAVSIDHVFSIAIALCGGLIWNAVGYQAVFAFGAFIAFVNLLSTRRINTRRAEINAAESARNQG
jgi:predicted MFS family arabinose efflux permease